LHWTKQMTKQTNPEPLVDLTAVADFLGISGASIRKWRERGAMPFPVYAVGRALRFRLSEVDRWVASTAHSNAAEARAMGAT
jgi:excisionase family DNA binding protein